MPRLFGKLEVIEEAEKLASNNEMKKAIARVKEIYETIKRLGYGSYISIDFGMIQHLHYYTGVIFRGYIRDVGGEIVSGGRYDELIGNFGEAMPAVGLAVQVNQIVRTLQEHQAAGDRKKLDILIHYSLHMVAEAERLCGLLRKDGRKVELSMFETLQDTFQFARENEIRAVVEASRETLVEYVWDEKWIKRKEGNFMRNIQIALTKGRLEKHVIPLFEKIGIDCSELKDKGRRLVFQSTNANISFILVKAVDVATYVEHGIADIGIVGKDILLEYEKDIYEMVDLEVGCCKFCVASIPTYNPKSYRKRELLQNIHILLPRIFVIREKM